MEQKTNRQLQIQAAIDKLKLLNLDAMNDEELCILSNMVNSIIKERNEYKWKKLAIKHKHDMYVPRYHGSWAIFNREKARWEFGEHNNPKVKRSITTISELEDLHSKNKDVTMTKYTLRKKKLYDPIKDKYKTTPDKLYEVGLALLHNWSLIGDSYAYSLMRSLKD